MKKKIISLVLSLCMLISVIATVPFNVSSETIETKLASNGIWDFNESTGTLTFSGNGNYEYSDELPWKSYLSSIKNLIFEDDVTSISGSLFKHCKSLAYVTIPCSVKSIGKNTFTYCKSLKNIYVDSNNQYYSSINGDLYNKDQTTLIQYAIGKTDKEFTVPDTVKNIGESAFENSINLTSVVIQESVATIGIFAFYGCKNLISAEIMDGVICIGSHAFEYCGSLKKIIIPDGVSDIDGFTFQYCKSLENIIIPNSVFKVGVCAFYGCENINSVFYTGTKEQWERITIGKENTKLLNATIQCIDSVITPSVTTTESCTTKPEILIGDVNLDGTINISDAKLLIEYILKPENLTDKQLVCADTNYDNRINIADVTKIQKCIAGFLVFQEEYYKGELHLS